MSDEEVEKEFLEQGIDLDSPDADGKINYGTAAPNCQPKHTTLEQEQEFIELQSGRDMDDDDDGDDDSDNNNNNNASDTQEGKNSSSSISSTRRRPNNMPAKHRRESGSSGSGNVSDHSQEPKQKRQHNMTASQQQQQQKKMSYIQMAKMGYQELVNAIIRPPRAEYKMEALGPPAFMFCGKRFTRTDFTLRTKRGYNLECSHWEPVERATDRIPVVIYMHGNSSARVEVIPQLSYLLSLGVAVFAFDFAGSGKSDGDYVSLGYYEREDLSCIVAHLRATNVVSTIALWGRSMGAATSLMFGDRDPSIACMILDSPFADLTQLCEELVDKGREQGIVVPSFVVGMAIRMLQGSVKKQAGFNIKQISPISHADRCFIPALFVAGEHDDFIRKHHAEDIYEKYAGDKNIIIVEGDHNSPRPKFMFDSASIFLQTCLQIPNNWALDVPISMNLMCPPWYFEMYENRARRRAAAAAAAASASASASSSSNTSTKSKTTPASADGSTNAAASGNGFDHEQMGMTSERQRVIQASLFKMLGQADTEDGVVIAKEEKADTVVKIHDQDNSNSSDPDI